MRSRTIRLSEALAEATDILAENFGYPNWSAYVRGCLIREASNPQSHGPLQKIIERMSLQEQDALEEYLLKYIKHSIKKSGSSGGGSGASGPEAT